MDGLARNREVWAAVNAQVTDAAAEPLWRSDRPVWGLFGAPDAAHEGGPGVLERVRGLRVLELACGTAYVSAWLARRGARVVAFDLSEAQLATARRCQRVVGPDFPLVQADAAELPVADASVDLVVSEHGAAAWCDPGEWVPEAARVLRPGGRLAFLTNSALSALCVPADGGVAGERLLRGVRDVASVAWPGGGVEHHPSHGAWIDVLTSCGFVVDALREVYAPPGAADPGAYEIVTAEWAGRWPAEELWLAHRH